MTFSKFFKLFVVAIAMTSVIGCASKRNANMANSSKNNAVRTAALEDNYRFYGENISPAEESALQNKRVVYFGFDRYDVSPQDRKLILAHAKKMLENPNLKLRVDGHTDERGSREYNVGLGERRAKAVARVLALKGVSEDRVVPVSYGKEKPVALGHDEGSWGQNRRAEFEYEG